MTFESACSFFIAIVIFGVTPGPGTFAILARALVRGAAACFFLALGMAISDIIYLVLACYGLAALAEHFGVAFTVVRFVGAVYLLYLGLKLWRSARQSLPEAGLPERAGASFGQGFLISASNPKVILFYIAFLPTFVDMTSLAGVDIALAALLTLIGLMLGLMLVAAGAATARRLLDSPRGQRLLSCTSGSVMIGAGIFLAVSG